MDRVAAAVAPCLTAIQAEALGTGHAALAAAAVMQRFAGDVFILFGDTPLITPETLRAMVAARSGYDLTGIIATSDCHQCAPIHS